MSKERVFAKGFYVKQNPQAPDYVIGNLSIKADEAIEFIKEHTNDRGWVNLSMMKSKEEGKAYIELNTYEPKQQETFVPDAPQDDPLF
jgi:hypothetical protein